MALCLGYFMVILDNTIVNVAIPALHADLRAGVAGLQWVVDGYLLMFAAGLLTGGALADRVGARKIFQLGLGVFVVASAGCGLAPSTAVLVIARLVQGAGAALSVPASLALLRAAFPDSSARARAIGVWGGIAGLAAATGPILGGVLVSAASWRLVFFVNLPIGLLAMALTARYVPAAPGRPSKLDPPAQLTGVLALAALTFALIQGGHGGLTPLVAVAIGVFVAATIAFVLIERRVAAPMLPLGLFGDATFTGGAVVGLLINLGFYGELFVLNLYFQQQLHYSALIAGVALLPQMAVVATGSALSGRFTARTGGPRATMLIGLLVGGAGLLGLMAAGAHTGYPVLIVPLLAAGFGMSFTMPAATTAVVEAVPPERAGLASGVVNAARQVGGVVGIALLGVLVSGDAEQFVAGLRVAMAIAGAAFLLGAALTTLTVSRTRQE
ncbi:MAG TPA: MFS transporter [Pseudonocardiaceae bacterium]|jgi:DHA2 family methylenomycin A resistance protein-like MFS transporter|nr:MFS transporter [Pseudonocardiaceae bacterium]